MDMLPDSEWISVVDSIRSHSLKSPEHCAVLQDGVSISYARLDVLSDNFARSILAAGISEGQSVALFCERSVQVVVAMLGCLKSGVPFVPIDTAFPDERIQYMLDDASVALILTDANTQARAVNLSAASPTKLCQLEAPFDEPASCDTSIPATPSHRRAYIMYTSGSTGRPKGVPISHGALNCYCRADAQVYQLTDSDRTLQFATLSFDISIEEIFPPLCCGGTVVLRPSLRGDAQIELSDIIQRFSITAIHLATGYWHEWVDLMAATENCVPASLRLMVVTGEKVSPEHHARWQTLCQHPVLWANAYGPTEATVSATVFIPPSGWRGKALPIGKALPGYQTYILDEQQQPVKEAQTGELYIGGMALAEGYLNRPDLTASAFIPDPFSEQQVINADARNTIYASPRLYRTGDLARWLENDIIEYAGRIDHQLKVGSYRIEPGEIENAINEFDGVFESVVDIVASEAGRKQLLAYVAIAESAEHPSQISLKIKQSLERSLPVYMIPSYYVLMQKLPKTLNGKIDRKALPNATTAVLARKSDLTMASTDTEKALCDIWQEVLGIDSVGIHDSFLSLGGDSLMAIKAISRVQQDMQFSISTRDFFFLDTIALLAAHMEGRQVPRLVPPVDTFFINANQRQTYSVLQSPAPTNNNGIGILIVPSLGNEQRRCQRPFRSMMHTLARDGYHLLRFDWQGTANSSGCTSELRDVAAWLDDLQEAAHRLSQSVDQIHLVSVRVGALLSSLHPLDELPIAAAYHWDPVFDGGQWLDDMHQLQRGVCADTFRFLFKRKQRVTSLHEFAGLTLHPELHQAIQALDLHNILKASTSDYPIHLLLSDEVDKLPQLPSRVSVHAGCDYNDWKDPRALTHDMQINRAANLLVELMRTSSEEVIQCA